MDYICDFCQWIGTISLEAIICPHCHEEGWLTPKDEWVPPEDRPDNRQTIYAVIQELNDDTPELEEE